MHTEDIAHASSEQAKLLPVHGWHMPGAAHDY